MYNLILLVYIAWNCFNSYDALADAKIVAGTNNCNNPATPKALENNSTNRIITVTMEETTRRGIGQPVKRTFVISNLQPKERKNLGCQGCVQTSTGQYCQSYKVLAAYYNN